MERKLWTRAVSLGLLALAILLIGGNVYLSRMKQSLWEQSVSDMLEVTTQGGKTFSVYVGQGFSMLEGQAANFAQYNSTDTEAIRKKLDLYEDGDPSFAAADLARGILYFNSAEQTDLDPALKDSYLALPRQGLLEPFISEHTGRRVMGYYERFSFADGTPGMVRKAVPVSDISEQFTLSFYDGAGFSYIVNANGDILLRSGGESGNRTFHNVFDVVALDDNGSEDADAFRANMSGGKRGVMRLNFGGKENIFAFVPLEDTDGWYLVSIIPNQIIMERADRMMMISQLMVGGIAVALLLFSAFVLLLVRNRRQVRAKEAEVVYREQLFNLLANNTDDVFLMFSADRSVVEYVSPNVERVLGISMADLEKDVSCLMDLVDDADHAEELRAGLDIPLDGSISFEGKYTHAGTGEARWFVETIYHTMIADVERYIVILADHTEDRQKEAALNEALQIAKVANESKSAFLSNMSHDIRTPMNAVVGLAALLQRDADDPVKVREHTQKITASSQHLLGLINDVLDMSKIENGKTALNIGEFNLALLVEELDTIIRPQAKAKSQTFEIAVQDVRNENLVGDRLRISQVMINILSNAVKYTQTGGHVTMVVQELGQTSHGITRIRFVVTDDGIGMSEEYQREIFKPFSREVRTTVNQIRGTGLGMAITKNLVDLMGGSISVKSSLGEGSTFSIDLDLRVYKHEDDAGFWKEHNISKSLVVDDEPDICAGILSAMAGTGVEMQFALDGPTAIRMVQTANRDEADFDLILLDWKMPGMDGLETARQIRAKVPARIPIMILSSYDWEEIRDEGIAAGIDGFLSKPFFLSTFKEVIRSLRSPRRSRGSEENSLRGRRLLCVEDNELNLEILLELLDMEGAVCDTAVNGQEAVERFAASSPGTYDAILMDVQMPVMNGYEATRAIRALDHPEAAVIPIVAMTANAFSDDVRDAMDAGMNEHVAKPVDMAVLLEALGRLWRNRQ